MEVTRVEQRAYIKIAFLRERNGMECNSEFMEALGNNALPYRTVARWVGKFEKGHVSTSDEQRTGRLLSLRTDLARTVIEQLMDEDRRSRQQTKRQIEKRTNASSCQLYMCYVVILLHHEGPIALYIAVIN
ncbi:HTH_48 domain-containing protein [Trichonephila clavata]|uniref:HTH_48 domain-containing protein n=1 Tax=Trichonephila clavata TaxID=2740835 RepID=A0A8X6G007_TRICU|nr:HTH_48 domain-containing protein [Trichonephila clavata]